jgi:hypothetical protein
MVPNYLPVSTQSDQLEVAVPDLFEALGLAEAPLELQEAVALQLVEEVQAEVIAELARAVPRPLANRMLESVAHADRKPELAQADVAEAVQQYPGDITKVVTEIATRVRQQYVA